MFNDTKVEKEWFGVAPGKYPAKISDYGIETTPKGNQLFCVWFDTEKGSVKWTGGLSEKGRKYTLQALLTMGLTGPIESVGDGPIGGALNMTDTFNIVVAQQLDKNKAPTKYTQVKSIYEAKGKAKPLDPALIATAKNEVAKFNAELEAMKVAQGIPTAKPGF